MEEKRTFRIVKCCKCGKHGPEWSEWLSVDWPYGPKQIPWAVVKGMGCICGECQDAQ